MAWDDGYGHGGVVSEERKNGWRPVRARSSALAYARPAAELDILHGARAPV
jgi:hypothetical protein